LSIVHARALNIYWQVSKLMSERDAGAGLRARGRGDNGRLGERGIPRALLEADIATLQAALEQKRKEEVQQIVEQLRELDAQRTELNAKLMSLGHRGGGSSPAPRMRPAGGGTRGKRSELADGSVETILTEALTEHGDERPGFYYERVINAGGNRAQARRILLALVAGGKVKAVGIKPHTRYSLAGA
jgi:hypothetical protein